MSKYIKKTEEEKAENRKAGHAKREDSYDCPQDNGLGLPKIEMPANEDYIQYRQEIEALHQDFADKSGARVAVLKNHPSALQSKEDKLARLQAIIASNPYGSRRDWAKTLGVDPIWFRNNKTEFLKVRDEAFKEVYGDAQGKALRNLDEFLDSDNEKQRWLATELVLTHSGFVDPERLDVQCNVITVNLTDDDVEIDDTVYVDADDYESETDDYE